VVVVDDLPIGVGGDAEMAVACVECRDGKATTVLPFAIDARLSPVHGRANLGRVPRLGVGVVVQATEVLDKVAVRVVSALVEDPDVRTVLNAGQFHATRRGNHLL